MAIGIRLPTLYPMPVDSEQYWVFYNASLDELQEKEYFERIGRELEREDGERYREDTIKKLISQMVGKGFIRRDTDRYLPPETANGWAIQWSEKENSAEFSRYIEGTLIKWGYLFFDGLILAHEILTELERSDEALGPGEIWELLTDPSRSLRYDEDESYPNRTIGEFLRVLDFAGWVTREGASARITKAGKRGRNHLRNRSLYHQVERHYSRVDPVDDPVLTDRQQMVVNKGIMYWECGGKGKRRPLQEAHEHLFAQKYAPSLKREHQEKREEHEAALKALRERISELDPSFGPKVTHVRDRDRLQRTLDALAEGREDRASLVLDSSGSGLSRKGLTKLKHAGPDYSLASEIEPYSWQLEALNSWAGSRRGTLEVVTGAGKTVFALMAIARLLAEVPDARVTVLVPTKVLMYQWQVELVRLLGVPPDHLGLRGDGHKDRFSQGKRVVVSIINSAIINDELKWDVQALPAEQHHFLIADECHRYAGGEFSRVFEARYESSLGLSATPRSSDAGSEVADPVTGALGSVFFRYTYKEALSDDVIQPFTIHYIGVDLAPAERQRYDLFTKRIRRSLKKIRQRYGPRLEAMKGSFYANLHTILNTDESADPSIRRYFEAVRERKALVYTARNRKAAYLDIMTMRTVGSADEVDQDRIIVFDERIENVQEMVAPMDRRSGSADEVDKNLEALFFNPGFKPVMYHSARPSRIWNDLSMRLFRAGKANVMLSVKSLVEGVDVPAANVGVIRASSSSVRQRIQTTGRILRRAAGKDRADLYVIYVRATTDERIFRDAAWSDQVGTSAVNSIHWIPPEDEEGVRGDWVETELPSIDEWDHDDAPDFDVADLNPGDPYPGKYAGVEYHVDSRGRPFKKSRHGRIPITNSAIVEAAGIILRLKKGGKFVVSPEGHMVTPVEGELVFVGILEGEVNLDTSAKRRTVDTGDRAPTFEELFGGS